ncbi:hypothetical protein ACDA55_38135, partial [Rhizobium ruizarguesonis]
RGIAEGALDTSISGEQRHDEGRFDRRRDIALRHALEAGGERIDRKFDLTIHLTFLGVVALTFVFGGGAFLVALLLD